MTAYGTNIEALNYIASLLGGSSDHDLNLTALNDILTQLGQPAGYDTSLDAVNAWIVWLGGAGGFDQTLDALNEVSRLYGGAAGAGHTTIALNAIAEVALGPELVLNGSVLANTTSWIASTAVLSAVAGRLRVAGSASGLGRADQTIVGELGATYRFRLDTPTGTAASQGYRFRQNNAAGSIITSGAALVAPTKNDFVASAATLFLSMLDLTDVGYAEFDNISLRKLKP